MRNLKKILALVLALMMVLSVMVTSSAAFEDAAEIQHSEAVEVMSNLGILLGDGTNFNPNGTLTRAQAAVIIAKMLEGSVDNISVLVDAVDNPFTDVPSWALDFVLYAYSKGVVRGTSADKYTPNKNLTGYEFGKMVLVAAGICKDADFNNNWKMVVAEKLSSKKLLTGLSDLVLSKDLSREHAAQLAFNAMQYGTTTTYGYAVMNKGEDGVKGGNDDFLMGHYPTMVEAATAAAVLANCYYNTTATELPNGSLADTKFGLAKDYVSDGIGFEGYKWYVDVDASGAYNGDKDVYVSSFICTDTVVGTYTKANSWKEIAADLGKKTAFNATTYANGVEGAVWNIDPTSTDKCGTDSDVTLTVVVDAAKNVKFLYARELLTFASRSQSKVNDKTSPYYGLYAWTFTAPYMAKSVTVYAAANAYTNGAAYMVVPTVGAPVISAPNAIVGTIDGVATNKYIRVNGEVKYLSDDSADNGVYASNADKVVYLNSVGDVIYVGDLGDAAPTVYDGYVFVTLMQYVATEYIGTGLVGSGSEATISAKAIVTTPAGETSVVDVATNIKKVSNYEYVPQYWLGGDYVDVDAEKYGETVSVFGGTWAAYTLDENGAYKFDAMDTQTVTSAANKKAVVGIEGSKYYMDANTEIVFHYYNWSTGEVETYTNTGYANYNSGNYMGQWIDTDEDGETDFYAGEECIVVADPTTKVISTITFYCYKSNEDVVNYAVYAGKLEDGTTDAKDVYGFYVNGELKSYYTTIDLTGLTKDESLVTFKTNDEGKVIEATEITHNAVVGGYTYKVYKNNEIDAIAADGSYVVCGNYVNYMNSYGCLILDATNDYALGELVVGQTITIVDNGYGNTVIIITAQPVVE